MKIKITKCNNPVYWYSDKIGEIFSVIFGSVAMDGYHVEFNDNERGTIDFDDCEILNEEILRE